MDRAACGTVSLSLSQRIRISINIHRSIDDTTVASTVSRNFIRNSYFRVPCSDTRPSASLSPDPTRSALRSDFGLSLPHITVAYRGSRSVRYAVLSLLTLFRRMVE